MNAYAIFVVNEHLEYLLAEAASNRAVKPARPSLRIRIMAQIDGLLRNAERTYATSSLLPKFSDYPYRG